MNNFGTRKNIRNQQDSSIRGQLQHAYEILKPLSPTPYLDAEVLLAKLLHRPRSYLHARPEAQLDSNELAEFRHFVERRLLGEPIAYLVGTREFWSLDFEITRDVLIPRPETELVVETALKILPESAVRIADLGTGSGAIAIAIAHERPNIVIDACDISNKALALAKKNARRYNLSSVNFYRSNWLSDVPFQRYQLIASNPPYVASNDPHLQEGDVRFEPITTLVAGTTGFEAFEQIADQARSRLLDHGYLIFEHGLDQVKNLMKILANLGYSNIRSYRDIQNLPRVCSAQWIKKALK